jgi:hypothetical protein
MLSLDTPPGARNIADSPTSITDHFAKGGRFANRYRQSSLHLRPAPGQAGEDGYWTRITLAAHHDRERKTIEATLSLDEHRTKPNGMESTRFKIGRGAVRLFSEPITRYSDAALRTAYTRAVQQLRDYPNIFIELARKYDS